MSVETSRRRFTTEEYHQMAAAGIFSEDDRVELLQGEIVEMSPIGSRHAACVNRLNQIFSARLGQQAIVSVQNPIRLSDYSEPEPDLALLHGRGDFYADALPQAGDVWLVVEVAQSSTEVDREVKVPLYARSGISEVWLVDLEEERVEVYRHPGVEGYAEVQEVGRGQSLSPEAFPQVRLEVEEIALSAGQRK